MAVASLYRLACRRGLLWRDVDALSERICFPAALAWTLHRLYNSQGTLVEANSKYAVELSVHLHQLNVTTHDTFAQGLRLLSCHSRQELLGVGLLLYGFRYVFHPCCRHGHWQVGIRAMSLPGEPCGVITLQSLAQPPTANMQSRTTWGGVVITKNDSNR